MSIQVTRYDAFWEARFDPPQRHSDGPFVVRCYDELPGLPYRPLQDRGEGKDAWGCFDEDVLMDEELELLLAIRQRMGAS